MKASELPLKIVVWDRKKDALSSPSEHLIAHRLRPYLPEMAKFPSTRALSKSALWPQIREEVLESLQGVEYGFYGEEGTTARKNFFRVVYFNLSGEISYASLVETLRVHPILGMADLYFFMNADLGLARTGNINLIRSLALERSYHYIFAPNYFLLDPSDVADHQHGLVGHALMSRFPLEEFQVYPMGNHHDPMKSVSKHLGMPRALFARMMTPAGGLNVLLFGLEPISSPRQRAKQMLRLLKHYEKLPEKIPLLLAGDWQTTNYNTRNAARLFMSFLNKIIRGFDYIAEEHHAHPEIYFERRVFRYLNKIGLDYENLNQMGLPTWHCRFEDLEVKGGLSLKVANAMIRLIKKYFYHGPEQISLKTDWLAGSWHIVPSDEPQAERPKILPNHYSGGTLITKHHPMVLDFELRGIS